MNKSVLALRHHRARALTVLEVLVGITLIVFLTAFAWPKLEYAAMQGRMVSTMNNARQIYLASFQMAADRISTGDLSLGWPGDLAAAKVRPVKDLPDYVERMIEQDYLHRGDAGKMFYAPGIPMYLGTGRFESKHSAFKLYKVKETDTARHVVVATKNFSFGRGLDSSNLPFKGVGCLIVRMAGDAEAFNKRQARNTDLIGFMPGATTKEAPGIEAGNVLE